MGSLWVPYGFPKNVKLPTISAEMVPQLGTKSLYFETCGVGKILKIRQKRPILRYPLLLDLAMNEHLEAMFFRNL